MLHDKKIVVFGAGGLIGSEIVISALGSGAEVLALDNKKELMIEILEAKGCCIERANVSFDAVDVTSPDDLFLFFSKEKNISGVVNSTYPRNKTYGTHFLDVTLESFNENLALHLGSAFLLLQQCAKYFLKYKKPLSVVNLSSIYGVCAPRFDIYAETNMTMPPEYAAIKSAIIHLNKYVAAYIKNSDFRINSVSPGGIFDNQPESFLKAYRKETNGKGMLSADDIVGTILFLLSDKSIYITGQNIIVDDGFTL
jgi:NAD(P)-dependent dehydrogenase (short-subunit alcohol dehydrogenase family)